MAYRGEDVPNAHGDWGRQQPWQPSPATAPGHAGAWGDGSLGYGDGGYPDDGGYGPDGGYPGAPDGGYPAPDGGYPGGPDGGYPAPNGGYPGGPGDGYPGAPDGGYPGQGQPGYGPQHGQYSDPYEQRPYGGYGPGQGQGGYGGPQGYPHDEYGYDQPAPGYGTGGYQGTNPGYGRSGGYPVSPLDGYSEPGYGSGGYPMAPGRSGAYPVADAGNDWYGAQPAAANGASFADTGSYALNGRVADEYGTGPRRAMRDPVRGYPPGPGQQGTGPMPAPARSALPAPAPSVAQTRQQERLDESTVQLSRAPGGGFRGTAGSDLPGTASGGLPRAASGSFPASSGTGAFEDRGGYDDDYPGDFADPGATGDPYQDRVDGPDGSHAARSRGRKSGKGGGRNSRSGRNSRNSRNSKGAGGKSGGSRPARSPLGGKRLLVAALGVVVFGIIAAAAYVFVLKPTSPAASTSAAPGPLPTASAQSSQQACVKQLGTYCHIETAADDPKPLTVAELYKPAFTNDQDKTSYSLVSTKLDKNCANAVIGQALIKALQTGKCTQVVRASYVSGNGKIMGTIGVVNLATTNGAHDAGKVVGKNDFIAPLTSAKGVASKLGNGTGVVEAEFKGHYLLLTWSEYVDGTTPTTKAQDAQLEQFSSDLVAGTANIALTQRMVTGAPASSGASS
jgi:hypothetical protein